MSYDLMVFEPAAAPTTRNEFLKWFEAQTEWNEEHAYDDPTVSSANLQAWFRAMSRPFPAMSGPFSPVKSPEDEATPTDYSCGEHVIYATFAWSQAEAAQAASFELAGQLGVGVFEVSSENAEVWLPEDGSLRLAFRR